MENVTMTERIPAHSDSAPLLGLVLERLRAVDRWLMTAIRWVLIVLLALMACVIFANVLVRYAQWGSLVWAEELARYAMVWLTLLAVGPVLRIGGHIAIDNLQDSLPLAVVRGLRFLILLLLVGLAVSMIALGLEYMDRAQHQLTASTQVSFLYVYAAIPLGGLIFLWCLAAVSIGYVRDRRFERDEGADDHAEGVQL